MQTKNKNKQKDIKNKHIITTSKIDIESILNTSFQNNINDISNDVKYNRIIDVVERVNNVVFHTTHFLNLYLLYLFHHNIEFPVITEEFIGFSMRTVMSEQKGSGRRPNEKNQQIMKNLKEFYNEHYEPLLNDNQKQNKISILNLCYFLQYEEIDIIKNIKNNIIANFIDYCKEFINKEWNLKDTLNNIDKNNELTKEQKILNKRNLSIELRIVKEDLFSPLGTPYKSNSKYHEWLNKNKQKIIKKQMFNETPEKNHINYDIKANPLDYLHNMIYVIDKLKNYGHNIQCIPLRSSFVPKYITIDTISLISIMVDENKGYYMHHVKNSKEVIWTSFFNLGHKIFKRKDYNFYFMIKTDGIGASVIFYRKDLNQDRLPKEKEIVHKEYYVNEIDCTKLKYKNNVGIDVGKDDLLHCTDGSKFFRYTANQRRLETRKKKYSKIFEKHKKEHIIENLNIKEWEKLLSKELCCTTDYDKFQSFLKLKLSFYDKLKEFYYKNLWRKLKFNSYINTQKSESKMINNFRKKFGDSDEIIITIGDYDQGSYHLKGKEPSKGKGLRKTFRKAGYKVFLVDEYRTSCKCHNCHGDTEKFMYRKNHKPIKNPETYKKTILVHGLLRCKSVKECGSLWNRDVNGCLNIRMLSERLLKGNSIPLAFQRQCLNNS